MNFLIKKLINDKNFYKKLVLLAVPMIIQNFIVSSLNMTDTIMVGALGENQIAAVGIANQYFFFYNLIILGLTTGFSIFISQYWGSKNKKDIKKVLGLEIICVLAVGSIFTLGALLIPNLILRGFTGEPQVLQLGVGYLKIVALSYVVTGLSMLQANALKSIGKSKFPMIVSIVAILINLILNYIFIFGKLGFKAMGVEGSALGTVVARAVEFIMITYFTFKKGSSFRGGVKEFIDMDSIFIKTKFKAVIPVILNDAFWALGMVLYTVAYGKIGTNALASVQISNNVQNMFLILCTSTASASLVMIGHQIGAGDRKKTIEYAHKFSIIAFIFGGVIGILLILASPLILHLFKVSEGVRISTINILRILGIICPIRSLGIVLIAGIFRGSGDAKYALKAESIAMWVVAIPLTFLGAVVFKLPVEKVAILVATEDIVKVILCVVHLKENSWIHDLVNNK